jgi:hypothetical protein
MGQFHLRPASGREVCGSCSNEGSRRCPVKQSGLPREVPVQKRKPLVRIRVVIGVSEKVLI